MNTEKSTIETCCVGSSHRGEKLNQNLINRLNRLEGQVRGVKGMVEKEVYCDDILIQVRAIRSALDSVSKLILENHVRNCLSERIRAGDQHSVNELVETIGRVLK